MYLLVCSAPICTPSSSSHQRIPTIWTPAPTMPQIAVKLCQALIIRIEGDTVISCIVNAHELIMYIVAILCEEELMMPAPSVKNRGITTHGVRTKTRGRRDLGLLSC